jgi:hypothetical protein
MSDADTEQEFTPTQELFLEVLVARWRLGDRMYTFGPRLKKTARQLEALGLVSFKSGPAGNGTILAWLTEAGELSQIKPDYMSDAEYSARRRKKERRYFKAADLPIPAHLSKKLDRPYVKARQRPKTKTDSA